MQSANLMFSHGSTEWIPNPTLWMACQGKSWMVLGRLYHFIFLQEASSLNCVVPSVFMDELMTIPPCWLLACPFSLELIVPMRATHCHLSFRSHVPVQGSWLALSWQGFSQLDSFPPLLWYWLAYHKFEGGHFPPFRDLRG